MDAPDAPGTRRRPRRAVRIMLTVFCVLTAAGFTSLFLLASRTSEYFAWTIEPPATAAFLGAGYGAGLLLSVLCLRSDDWAQVRLPFLTIAVFTWITTAATALHRDRLHLAAPGTGPVAAPAAWFWVAVYAVVPVAMAVVLLRPPQPARAAAERRTLPRWLALLLTAEGLVMGAVGLALFVAPGSAGAVWPWSLTPFTARAVAAWLLAFAVAAAASVVVADLAVLRIATVAYTAFGTLQLLAVGLHAGDVDWSDARAPLYVGLLLAVTATGAAGWVGGGRGRVPVRDAARAT